MVVENVLLVVENTVAVPLGSELATATSVDEGDRTAGLHPRLPQRGMGVGDGDVESAISVDDGRQRPGRVVGLVAHVPVGHLGAVDTRGMTTLHTGMELANLGGLNLLQLTGCGVEVVNDVRAARARGVNEYVGLVLVGSGEMDVTSLDVDVTEMLP